MIQTADPGAAVASIDRTWRTAMEHRASTLGPRVAALFDEAWGDMLCATWRGGRGPIEDEGQAWAILQTFLGYAAGRRRAGAVRSVLAESDTGRSMEFFEAGGEQLPRAEPAWIKAEKQRGGKPFEAVWLVNARGLTYPEACETLGVQEALLKGRLKSGRAALRRRLDGRDIMAMWNSEQRAAVEYALARLHPEWSADACEVEANRLEEQGASVVEIIRRADDADKR